MSKNSSAKYSKKKKPRKTEKKLVKGIKVFLEKRKTKQQDSIVKNDINVSQKIKRHVEYRRKYHKIWERIMLQKLTVC